MWIVHSRLAIFGLLFWQGSSKLGASGDMNNLFLDDGGDCEAKRSGWDQICGLDEECVGVTWRVRFQRRKIVRSCEITRGQSRGRLQSCHWN